MRLFLLLSFVASGLLLSLGCSDESSEDSTVEVTLTEWEVRPDVESVPEGDVTFRAENEGDENHELLVVKTDFDANELPSRDDGTADTGADGVDIELETSEIEDGDSDTRVAGLEAGSYVLICNLRTDVDGEDVSHYAEGMRVAFEVTEPE